MKLTQKLLEILFPITEKYDRQVFGPMSFEKKLVYWYAPWICLWSLPLCAFWYLFGDAVSTGKVMFSNDGPLGVMNSQWVREGYPPGQPFWVDTWWLGAGQGRGQLSITAYLYWMATNPAVFVGTVALGIFLLIHFLNNRYQNSKKPLSQIEEPKEPAYIPKNQGVAVTIFRLLALLAGTRFIWLYFVEISKPNYGQHTHSPTLLPVWEAALFFLFAFFVLPFWFSTEVEHREYACSVRPSK